jgi:hypothetical protein
MKPGENRIPPYLGPCAARGRGQAKARSSSAHRSARPMHASRSPQRAEDRHAAFSRSLAPDRGPVGPSDTSPLLLSEPLSGSRPGRGRTDRRPHRAGKSVLSPAPIRARATPAARTRQPHVAGRLRIRPISHWGGGLTAAPGRDVRAGPPRPGDPLGTRPSRPQDGRHPLMPGPGHGARLRGQDRARRVNRRNLSIPRRPPAIE